MAQDFEEREAQEGLMNSHLDLDCVAMTDLIENKRDPFHAVPRVTTLGAP